jgi:hypothetical protein
VVTLRRRATFGFGIFAAAIRVADAPASARRSGLSAATLRFYEIAMMFGRDGQLSIDRQLLVSKAQE